jgi:death-on-curing protein
MIYLTEDEIISINKDMILSFGGVYYEGVCNVKNDNSFKYLIAAPVMETFGVPRYPDVFRKAAAYLFFIIKDHIFCDGNKRTGMMAAFTFLDVNGVEITGNIKTSRIVNYAERIASCKPNIDNIARWLRNVSIS